MEETSLMLCFQLFLLSSYFFLFLVKAQAHSNIFNVIDDGARGDGVSDNTAAFEKTWQQVCQSTKPCTFMIPKGKFKVSQIILKGPCKAPINFHLQGDLVAPIFDASNQMDHWITFQYIDRLTINGGGSLDGQGPSAWPHNTCKNDPNCKPLPVSIRFDFVNNSRIDDITSINSKNTHINIFASNSIIIDRIHIIAPGDSPNTDGIHVAESNHVQILNSVIGTGDDCVAILPGAKSVNISNVQCGPGHGISIGSLGARPGEDGVVGVHVTNCNLIDTTNGIRIKTWGKPYRSTVSDITFGHINLKNVDNPIIIDQQYCPTKNCIVGDSGVKISDVLFSNIKGTSKTQIVVDLNCSKSNPCDKIQMRDINIAYSGGGGPARSSCSNAHGASYGQAHPPSCMLPDNKILVSTHHRNV